MRRAQSSGDAASMAEQKAQSGQFAADEQKRAANMGFLDTALGAAQAGVNMASAAGKFGGGGIPTVETVTPNENVFGTEVLDNSGVNLAESSTQSDYSFGGNEFNPPSYQYDEDGGKYPELSKTPGAFSHATNPIHIMRNGRKIGEMTGGEVILNPDQEKKVATQSPYFRQLLRKFNRENKK